MLGTTCEGYFPTILYFYSTHPRKSVGWIFPVGQVKLCFLLPYTSYKNFKGIFFKIVIEERG